MSKKKKWPLFGLIVILIAIVVLIWPRNDNN